MTSPHPAVGFNFGLLAFVLVLILIVLLLVSICAAGGYFYYKKKQEKAKPKVSIANVESGLSLSGTSLPLRSYSRDSQPTKRRGSSSSSPGSKNSSSSSDSSSPSINLAVRTSDQYPTKIATNRDGDKEISIEGLPTGPLVFVIKNKRDSPEGRKGASHETIIFKDPAVVLKSKEGPIEKKAVPAMSQSDAATVSRMTASTPPSNKSSSVQATVASSTVSYTEAKKGGEKPQYSKSPKIVQIAPTPSEVFMPVVAKQSKEVLSSTSSVATLDSLADNVPYSQNIESAPVPAFVVGRSLPKDVRVSPEQWSRMHSFSSLPAFLSRPGEGEKDIQRRDSVWKSTLHGRPVEGRTVKYNSRRVSTANPRQVAKAVPVSAVIQEKRVIRKPLSPPLPLLEKEIQPTSAYGVDEKQSSLIPADDQLQTPPTSDQSSNYQSSDGDDPTNESEDNKKEY